MLALLILVAFGPPADWDQGLRGKPAGLTISGLAPRFPSSHQVHGAHQVWAGLDPAGLWLAFRSPGVHAWPGEVHVEVQLAPQRAGSPAIAIEGEPVAVREPGGPILYQLSPSWHGDSELAVEEMESSDTLAVRIARAKPDDLPPRLVVPAGWQRHLPMDRLADMAPGPLEQALGSLEGALADRELVGGTGRCDVDGQGLWCELSIPMEALPVNDGSHIDELWVVLPGRSDPGERRSVFVELAEPVRIPGAPAWADAHGEEVLLLPGRPGEVFRWEVPVHAGPDTAPFPVRRVLDGP